MKKHCRHLHCRPCCRRLRTHLEEEDVVLLKSRWMQLFCSTCISFNPSFKKPLLKQAFFQCIGCHILASHRGATSVQSDMLPSFGVFYQVLIGDFPKSQLGIFPSPSWGFSQVPVGGFPKSQLGVFPSPSWGFSQW